MIEAIRNLSKSKKEPEWLLNTRLNSWDNFLKLDLPKTDEWKYTDLSSLDFSSIGFGNSQVKINADNAEEIDAIKECFFEDDKFDFLNNALFTDAILLHVKEGRVKLSVDIEDWCFVKVFLLIDGDAEIEEIIKGRGNAFLSCKLLVSGNVVFKYNQLSDKGHVFNHKKISILDNSTFKFGFFESGGNMSRLKVETIIGRDSSSFIRGGFIGKGEQHFNLSTVSIHKDEYSKNDILIKGVLRERASSAFFGSIVVEKKAQKTDSYLADHVLLMDDARANSIPSLKIEANDVRATHGATVTQLDEEQIFYLMSRGIERKKAELLCATAFLREIEEINTDEIIKIIEEKLA